MEQQQGKHEPVKARNFNVNNRKFRRRIKRAILAMPRNNEVGLDNIHSEMLQKSPTLFARVLKKMWEVVGSTTKIPTSWTHVVLVPLLKKGDNDKPAN